MATANITLGIASNDVTENVTHATEYNELAQQTLNVAPGASAIALEAILAQLGVASKAKFILVKSDRDGVVANVTTATGETAVLGAYPFFATGLDNPGMSVASPFALTVELPAGDQTAHVRIVAFG